jgi:hypothetical protein
MVGKTKDPKGTRITVRISDKDLEELQAEARRRNCTVGAVVRSLIRECLESEPTPAGDETETAAETTETTETT